MGKKPRIFVASHPYPGPAVAQLPSGISGARQAQVMAMLWNFSQKNGRIAVLCWTKDQLPVLTLVGVTAGSLGWRLQERSF